jgi:small subunit ribosomal protein S10
MAKKAKIDRSVRIQLKSYDHKIIDNSAREILKVVDRYGVEVKGPIPLPTRIKKYSVKKSPFIHEDAQEQFEIRIHKRLMDIVNPSSQVIDALRDLSLPAGVQIKLEAK